MMVVVIDKGDDGSGGDFCAGYSYILSSLDFYILPTAQWPQNESHPPELLHTRSKRKSSKHK